MSTFYVIIKSFYVITLSLFPSITHPLFSLQLWKPRSPGGACRPRSRSWRSRARWSWSSAGRCCPTTPPVCCSAGCSSTSDARTRSSDPAARSSTSSREPCERADPSSCPICSRGWRKTCTSLQRRANGSTTSAERARDCGKNKRLYCRLRVPKVIWLYESDAVSNAPLWLGI